ncbi:MAG TPA: hypothetical protein VHO94_01055 [Oscillospiraceae bacterium]|nr:hypothetical protein [Oscillospiraceae bacterium]
MILANVMKRSAIGATVGIALKGIKSDPKRSIRNTVDLFERFTVEIFDSSTINKIRHEADNPNSSFFKLVTKVTASVDNTMIKKVATNLCCNRLILFPDKELENKRTAADFKPQVFSEEALNSIVERGVNAGSYFFVINSENPFQQKDALLNVCRSHSDCVFYIHTNGNEIDDQLANEIIEAGNIILAVTIDQGNEPTELCNSKAGVFELLQRHHCLYGFCVASEQTELCFNSGFVDCMIAQGCSFGWYTYGSDADPGSMDSSKNPLIGIGKPILLATPKSDAHYLSHFSIGGRCYISFNEEIKARYLFPVQFGEMKY